MEYTTADVLRAIAATVAPYVLIPLTTALICWLFPIIPWAARELLSR